MAEVFKVCKELSYVSGHDGQAIVALLLFVLPLMGGIGEVLLLSSTPQGWVPTIVLPALLF